LNCELWAVGGILAKHHQNLLHPVLFNLRQVQILVSDHQPGFQVLNLRQLDNLVLLFGFQAEDLMLLSGLLYLYL